MDREPRHVLIRELDLPGMQPRSDANSQRSNLVADIDRATDGSCGAIERGQHAVAGGLDLATAVSVQLALTSGCFISAMADAFITKSFTDNLYAAFLPAAAFSASRVAISAVRLQSIVR